jgi:hypothetical protein
MRRERKSTGTTFMNHIYKERVLIIFSVRGRCGETVGEADFKKVKRRILILLFGRISGENE